MSAAELTALLVFCTAMSFSPGPNTTLSTALAANLGLRRALRFCVAVPTGWTLLMLGSGLGLGALVLGVPTLRLGVKFVGVAYMLWLACKLIGVRFQFRPRNWNLTPINLDPPRLDVTFWQGVGLQFLNIKAWMLALTLTAGWVVNAAGQPSTNPGERLAIICLVMVVFAFTSNFTYALIGSLLREWLAQGRRLVWFNRALALVLAGTAAWMVTV
jgi:threonine/homoserine/homoserine lactone efflux protein